MCLQTGAYLPSPPRGSTTPRGFSSPPQSKGRRFRKFTHPAGGFIILREGPWLARAPHLPVAPASGCFYSCIVLVKFQSYYKMTGLHSSPKLRVPLRKKERF